MRRNGRKATRGAEQLFLDGIPAGATAISTPHAALAARLPPSSAPDMICTRLPLCSLRLEKQSCMVGLVPLKKKDEFKLGACAGW